MRRSVEGEGQHSLYLWNVILTSVTQGRVVLLRCDIQLSDPTQKCFLTRQ